MVHRTGGVSFFPSGLLQIRQGLHVFEDLGWIAAGIRYFSPGVKTAPVRFHGPFEFIDEGFKFLLNLLFDSGYMFDAIIEPGRHTGVDFAKKTFAYFLNIHSSSPVPSHPVFKWRAIRTNLKNRILVQGCGGAEFLPLRGTSRLIQ